MKLGIYDDGTPRNILSDAYLLPEYDWAQNTANYNQTNLTLDLNIESDGTINDELHAALNNNRGSKNDERDDFWIGYFLIAYQGEIERDADADSTPNSGISTGMPNSLLYCDCYQSTATCPSLSPPPISCSAIPTGAFGSVLYEEVMQDVHRAWSFRRREFENIKLTAPHELGHQFGLKGDAFRPTFKIMDYSVYTTNPSTTVLNEIGLHPEHIKIIRKRTSSPGEEN